MAELVGRVQEPDGTEVSGDFLSLLALISLRSHDDISLLRPTAAIAGDVARALGHGASDEQADTGTTSVAKLERTGREIVSSVVAKFDRDLGGMLGNKARGAPQSAVPLEAVERSLETLHEHGRAVERYHYDVGDSQTGVLWRAASAPLMSTLDEVLHEIDYQGLPALRSPMWESQLEVAFLTVLVLRMRSDLAEDSVSDVVGRVFGVTETSGMTNHTPETLDALRNGGVVARGVAGQRKYELDENWAAIGISRLREEIRAVVPASETPPQQAAQQENLPRTEDAQPLNDGQAALKLRYIPHDDIYQAVLRIISDAPSTMSQQTVNDLARSSLGIPDSEAHYVKPGTDRTLFSTLVRRHGLKPLLGEGKITQVPGGFERATSLSAGESVPAGGRVDDKRPEVEAAEADALERLSEPAASIADAADGDRSKRLDRTERSGFARRCAEYATALQELVEMEGRESEVVAGADFDLIGWRKPTMTTSWTVDAFAYRFVEDAASLHGGLADQMRSNLAAIRSYLQTKPELKGVGVGVQGRVLVSEPFTENARKTLLAAWNPSGKPHVEVNVVPLPPSPTNVVPVPNAGSVPNAAGLIAPIVQALREAGQPLGEDDLSWRIHEKLGLDDVAWTYKVNPSHPLPKFLHELKIARERLTKEGQIERGADGWRVTSGEDVAGATAPPRDDSPAGEPESLGGSTTAGDEGSTVLIDPFVPRVTPLLLNILKDAEQPLTAREIEQRVRAELDRDSTGAAVATERDDITRARGGLANAALIEFRGGRWTVTEAGRIVHGNDSDEVESSAHASSSVAADSNDESSRRAEVASDADITDGEDWAWFEKTTRLQDRRWVEGFLNVMRQEMGGSQILKGAGEVGAPFELLCRAVIQAMPGIKKVERVGRESDWGTDLIGFDSNDACIVWVQCKFWSDRHFTSKNDVSAWVNKVRTQIKASQSGSEDLSAKAIWVTTGPIDEGAEGVIADARVSSRITFELWSPDDLCNTMLNGQGIGFARPDHKPSTGKQGTLTEYAGIDRAALREFRRMAEEEVE